MVRRPRQSRLYVSPNDSYLWGYVGYLALGRVGFGTADDGVSDGPPVLVFNGDRILNLQGVSASRTLLDDDGVVNHAVQGQDAPFNEGQFVLRIFVFGVAFDASPVP